MKIPNATLNKLKTGIITDPRGSTLKIIANYFDISVGQLLGTEPMNMQHLPIAEKSIPIPVLTYEQVLQGDLPALINANNHTEWTYHTLSNDQIKHHNIFAIKPIGCAMLPLFTDGNTITIIDCNATISSKNYILVHIARSGELLFRQILIDGLTKILKPTNPEFSSITLTDEDNIIGVVVALKKELI